MTWVAAAVIGSSLISASASKSAAGQQSDAANRSSDMQMQMFNTQNEQQAPYRQAGYNALNSLNMGFGLPTQKNPDGTDAAGVNPGIDFTHQFNASDLQTNLAPNYQWQLDQGLGATKNAGNLQTGLLSGNSIRGINDYAQNFAGNAYQNAFNNYNTNQSNIFNRLSSIAGLGQTANQATGNMAMNTAGNVASTGMAGAAAQAAGTVGSANALSGGLNNALGWYQLNKMIG